jgi:hypothetical protein
LALIPLQKPGRLHTQAARALLVFALGLAATGCAKKSPKPVHTEPWLAHPPASASASPDAAVTLTRYVLTEQSQIKVELWTKRGKVAGKLSRVSGELDLALGALAQSRGQVRAQLDSLTVDADSTDAATWLARARNALGLADAGSANPGAVASFDLTLLEDVSPEALEPALLRDGGSPSSRRVRATAEGNLLLNGFRVLKREPLEAEFGFTSGSLVPATVVIRSRAPLVISLETHQIQLGDPVGSGAERRRARASAGSHDVRISVELYGRKD